MDPFERDRQTLLQNRRHQKNTLSLIEETEHIQNKAFFDAINESMNFFRPHSFKGQPLPFEPRPSVTPNYTSLPSADHILIKIKSKIQSWMQMNVGALPSDFFLNPHGGFDELGYNEHRENQLADILQRDISESEQQLVNYTEDEIFVKLELSEKILDFLVWETIGLLP